MPPRSDATDLLRAWSNGDESAFDKLVPLVYQELRALASRYMRRERADHTLQATALVNEAYVRLIDAGGIRSQDRAHFLAVASQTMRRILVEFARQRGRQKRGGDVIRVTLDDAPELAQEQGTDLIALNDALSTLATVDLRMSQVVELRFFGGLSVQETADVLSVSPETVMRDWKTAKVWLLRELSEPQRSDSAADPRAG